MTGRSIVDQVPRGAVVLTPIESLPQFSGRFVYEFPSIPDYRMADYLFAEKDRLWYRYRKETWDAWLATGYFDVLAQTDTFLLARRKPLQQSLQIQYADQMTLLGDTVVATNTLQDGTTLRPIVGWRADKTISKRYKFTIQVVDKVGHLWAEEDSEPLDGISPTNRWSTGGVIYDQYTLPLPVTMPAGEYQIAVGVHVPGDDAYALARDSGGRSLGTMPVIATLHIDKNKASRTVNQLVTEQPIIPSLVDLHDMRFLGYYPLPKLIYQGADLPVGLYWRAREKPSGDYLVAVQLRDAAGRVAFEQVSRPANNTYPTTQWDKGEVLLDWHDLVIPKDLAPGEYQISAVLKDDAGNVLGEAPLSHVSLPQ